MQDTNLEITAPELELISDPSFFDRKAVIMKKISGHLGLLCDELAAAKPSFEKVLPDGVFSQQGKISRGENYKGYPYLVLDYPRIFDQADVFAFRSMFWWGKHFSYTLHVGGIYYEKAKDNFIRNYDTLLQPGIYTCIHNNPWEYHFDEHNYKPAKEVDPATLIKNKTGPERFLKLSCRKELSSWNNIGVDGKQYFELFTRVLYSEKKS